MHRHFWFLLVFVIPANAFAVDFAKDVAPILEKHCVRCHQPGNAKGKLSVATIADLLAGGHVVPGKPIDSSVLELITPEKPGERPRMPKDGRMLSDAEVATLRQWIADGANWPKEYVVKERSKADKSWWSLRALPKVVPPSPVGLPADWEANPIDRFVFAKLREKGLSPSPPADPRTLIRRLTFDLTGLPPTPEAVEAFAKNPTDDAYAKLVNDLLASPAYGERFGRHWLDVVRFGESNGYERNVIINNAWPFRDYVIKSFNDDKPFDRLVREHLAGDVLTPGTPAVEVGTAFLVTGPYDNVGNNDPAAAAVIRANTLDEITRTTGEAFLGVTVGCARCHNHKFDPITQQDYHRIATAFAGVTHPKNNAGDVSTQKSYEKKIEALNAQRKQLIEERNKLSDGNSTESKHRLADIAAELKTIEVKLEELHPPAQWISRFVPAPGPFNVFIGGDPRKKGESVAFASPDFLSETTRGFTLPDKVAESAWRKALADWIVASDNPLTPRVLANRLWGWHFGTGIVDTPSDFGYMGSKPTHPELLDWLANQIREDGWKLKPSQRLIVLSRSYRQASAFRKDAAEVDGDSRLLWRFPPRRLSGEEVRDAMLGVAGKLNTQMGGPGYRLYRYVQDNVATYHPLDNPGPETYRRAVYHQNARAARTDVLTDFDCPDPAAAAPRRSSTTTPMQALTLFNHVFTLDMADALAKRVETDGGLAKLYLLVYGRPVRDTEAKVAEAFIAKYGLRAYCRAMLNSNEFLYVD